MNLLLYLNNLLKTKCYMREHYCVGLLLSMIQAQHFPLERFYKRGCFKVDEEVLNRFFDNSIYYWRGQDQVHARVRLNISQREGVMTYL
jgi:hypothetical protein